MLHLHYVRMGELLGIQVHSDEHRNKMLYTGIIEALCKWVDQFNTATDLGILNLTTLA